MCFRQKLVLAGALLGSIAASAALAAGCPSDYTATPDAYSLLINKRVIASTPPGASSPDEWKEDHCTGNRVFKVGLPITDPKYSTDPYREIAFWNAVSSFVVYNYGDSGSPYTWRVLTKAGDTEICFENFPGDTVIAEGTVEPGSCPP